jgi:trimeric autotransporter adhesin
MSTKTTFKRVALVAVAALGLGVLSVAPSSATVISTTVTAGTAGATDLLTATTASSDTTTGTFVTVTSLFQGTTETSAVTFVQKSAPAGSTVAARMIFIDTTGSTTARVSKSATSGATATKLSQTESETAGGNFYISNTGGAGYAGATFSISLESATATAASGTYVYTVVVTNWTGATQQVTQYTADVSIVVSKSTELSTTPSAVKSFANLIASGQAAGTAKVTDDAVLSKVATAGTAGGYIFVGNRNSSDASGLALDSLTATVTGAGVVCTTTGFASPTVGTCGKSIKVAATGDYQFAVQADGTAGTSSVAVTSSILGVTYTKTLSYYGSSAKTITASAFTPVLTVGTNDSAVVISAVDANGTNWTGTAYIYASSAADALIGGSATTPVACVPSTDGTKQYCKVTTIAAGTAKFKVIDKSTIAAATATSNEVSVTASAATAATVKLAFDKATYAPGEKAILTITPVDASGNKIAGTTANYLAAALTTNVSVVSGGSTVTSLGAASVTTVAYDGTDKTAGTQSIVVYMPQASGTLTVTGKGGTSLPLAGQVAVSASADVVNASVDAATDAANEATDAANAATDAALAAADAADAATAAAQDASDAVAALSASVSKLISSLRAQITSLTNLVIKIQKKVRA